MLCCFCVSVCVCMFFHARSKGKVMGAGGVEVEEVVVSGAGDRRGRRRWRSSIAEEVGRGGKEERLEEQEQK